MTEDEFRKLTIGSWVNFKNHKNCIVFSIGMDVDAGKLRHVLTLSGLSDQTIFPEDCHVVRIRPRYQSKLSKI